MNEDNRATIIVTGMVLAAIILVIGVMAAASMQNTKARTDAQVTKYQEHTKRAEGRHSLVDVLGLIKERVVK